jgi:IS5 family transposase
MRQMGFFDLSDRYALLDAKKDPLVEINSVVPWEEFRPALDRVWRKPDEDRKSCAGRKPMDSVLMFKTLVLSALYNLSDDQIEYQVRDLLSFMRFLGLGLGDRVPDANTVWLYREALAQAGMMEELFGLFDGHLARRGYIARGGQILDASIVPVPRNHNKREENAAIKAGETPGGWADEPAKRSQKDVDARWTKKHGKSHYGYKNHVNVDRTHKLIRRYHVTDAAVHDSQVVEELLTRGNTGSGVWADAAYRSAETEAVLKARKLTSHIHRKGKRGKPLTEQSQKSNRTKSSVRVRVEHIFGAQANDMGGTLVRTIGLARAKAKIGMKNLAYNIRRLGQLGRFNPCPV